MNRITPPGGPPVCRSNRALRQNWLLSSMHCQNRLLAAVGDCLFALSKSPSSRGGWVPFLTFLTFLTCQTFLTHSQPASYSASQWASQQNTFKLGHWRSRRFGRWFVWNLTKPWPCKQLHTCSHRVWEDWLTLQNCVFAIGPILRYCSWSMALFLVMVLVLFLALCDVFWWNFSGCTLCVEGLYWFWLKSIL